MKYQFAGSDFGVFVFGRKVLKSQPNAEITFNIGDKKSVDFLSEDQLWQPALEDVLANKTRFGRVGVFYDRKNLEMQQFRKNFSTQGLAYNPRELRRAEKNPRIFYFETQLLTEMANEGLSDTVEFRRLARKFLREAKHANLDTLLIAANILAADKTRQILQHLAGSQLQLCFPVDFFEPSADNSQKRFIEIHTNDSLEFTKKSAEKLLRTKLAESDLHQ